MELVFWQNMISIHQKDFLEALAVHEYAGKIMLVAEQDLSEERKKMGWNIPELRNIEVTIAPDAKKVKSIIEEHPSAVHIFSGFNVGGLNTIAMKICIGRKSRIAIMSEPYNLAGNKGRIRKLRFRWDKLRYNRHISFILAIGREGVSQYKEIGFDAGKVFPWGYFINMPETLQQRDNYRDDGKCKIMYAGRIEEAKGILRFTQALLKQDKNFELDLYGEGDDLPKIKDAFAAKDKSDMLRSFPFLKYEGLLKSYAGYNWLVLPSTQKDGWGAVVSEALLNGLRVICSTKAGASLVIKEGWNGLTFNWLTDGDCDTAILKMLAGNGFADPMEIIKEANISLTGKAGAQYFVRILQHKYENAARPLPPWG